MDPSPATQPTQPTLSSSRSPSPARLLRMKHRLEAGARLQLNAEGERRYSVSCSCGWESEACGTAVLAEADGEQHVTLAQVKRVNRRTGGA